MAWQRCSSSGPSQRPCSRPTSKPALFLAPPYHPRLCLARGLQRLLPAFTIGSSVCPNLNPVLQVAAFREGFSAIFPLEALQAFFEDEIEAMLCGERLPIMSGCPALCRSSGLRLGERGGRTQRSAPCPACWHPTTSRPGPAAPNHASALPALRRHGRALDARIPGRVPEVRPRLHPRLAARARAARGAQRARRRGSAAVSPLSPLPCLLPAACCRGWVRAGKPRAVTRAPGCPLLLCSDTGSDTRLHPPACTQVPSLCHRHAAPAARRPGRAAAAPHGGAQAVARRLAGCRRRQRARRRRRAVGAQLRLCAGRAEAPG